jgi:hypothetical protein
MLTRVDHARLSPVLDGGALEVLVAAAEIDAGQVCDLAGGQTPIEAKLRYVRLVPRWHSYPVRAAAVAVVRGLERRRPETIPAAWWKEERGARTFVDYNQNAPHKTVFGARGVRARGRRPGLRTAALGGEVFELHPDELTLATVTDRLDRLDDPWKDIDEPRSRSSRCLPCMSATVRTVCSTPPWPPLYPEMPDEPHGSHQAAPERTRPVDSIIRSRKAALGLSPLEAPRMETQQCRGAAAIPHGRSSIAGSQGTVGGRRQHRAACPSPTGAGRHDRVAS